MLGRCDLERQETQHKRACLVGGGVLGQPRAQTASVCPPFCSSGLCWPGYSGQWDYKERGTPVVPGPLISSEVGARGGGGAAGE